MTSRTTPERMKFSRPFYLIFSLIAFLFLQSPKPAFSQQDAYHDSLLEQLETDYGITGGDWVFGDREETIMSTAYASEGLEKDWIDVEGMPFSKGFRLTTTTRPENYWEHSLQFGTENAISKDDVLLLIFWVRGISGERGRGFVRHSYELGGTPYTRSFSKKQMATEEWQQWMIPFSAALDMPSSWYKLHLGDQIQVTEIGGVSLINYGDKYTLEELPKSTFDLDYEGREPDAAWRAEAAQRIETHRKADIQLLVVDANDQPVQDAAVEIKMLRHAFGFGTAVLVPERLEHQFALSQEELDTYYNTFENLDGDGNAFNWAVIADELRWSTWEDPYWPGDGQQHTINFFNWLKERNTQVRGHVLVWPRFDRLPPDIEENQNDADYIRQRISAHIQSIVGHPQFKGRMLDWNVINEAAHETDLENVFGGIDEYAEWFKIAHEADPAAKLYINEYNILSNSGMDINAQERFTEIVESIDANGGDVDGLGFEGHVTYPLAPPELVYEIIDEFAALGNGKEISISEYDAKDVEAFMGSEYMRDLLTIAFSHPAVKSFMMWGYWEKIHWLDDSPMFRDDWSLKPSGEQFIDLVYNKWWTEEESMTDTEGQVFSSGFLGDYEIKITKEGATSTSTFTLEKNNGIVKIVFSPTGLANHGEDGIFLEQNYPNPFDRQTQIAFTLNKTESVQLKVYDLYGKQLAVLVNEPLFPGKHKINFNAAGLPAGMYVYKLETKSGHYIKTMMLVR